MIAQKQQDMFPQELEAASESAAAAVVAEAKAKAKGQAVAVCSSGGSDFMRMLASNDDGAQQGGEDESAEGEGEPLPVAELPAVPALTERHVPAAYWAFIQDEAERVQAPPDYVAAALLAVTGALAASFAVVLPKRNDDTYRVWPNIYGCIVGEPGARKTPAAKAVLAFLYRLDRAAHERWQEQMREWECEREACEAMRGEARRKATQEAAKGKAAVYAALQGAGVCEAAPVETRFIANWTTPEKLFALWAANPALMLHRDELAGLFDDCEKRGYEMLRSLLTQGFNGNPVSSDTKIGGTVRIDCARPSIFGTIQPEPLKTLRAASLTGRDADGLQQRIQEGIWPDDLERHQFIDRTPDAAAMERVQEVLERLAERAKACIEDGAPVQEWRFDEAAQESYARWCEEWDALVKAAPSNALANHYNKTPAHVAKLALQFQLVDDPNDECLIGLDALSRAIERADYLRCHALRVYGVRSAAAELLAKLEAGKLGDGFTARDVRRHAWAGLKTLEQVQAALDELVRCRWLRVQVQATGERGGRPTARYWMHKALLAKRSGKG